MLRERLSGRYRIGSPSGTPKSRYNLYDHEEQPVITEQKLALLGLLLSVVVISSKVITNYREVIAKAVLERRLISHEILSDEGNEVLVYSWKTVLKYSNIWLPALFGFLSSYFTWMMVYLDSAVPGVQPPSPLSPKRYKEQSGHTFHLNYVFSIIVGILVFSYMYLKGVSIEYEE
ncbi:unnamed protein product [Acanthoscelides obtectus]|uniref:Uncharacterized protein n=1 Tax=Acanthoscelides obtectus TaxID=200917 RepID=A0A9P0PS83_ACAOB|nr:unnamed protein product [Acanthoscelides obtectus]CAK1671045.1 ADP-ribosylation factor-like protein 6-interacting protein 6 [Acanthoscelides obtectus]